MKEYPDELTVIFYYNVCVAVLAANVALFMESSLDAWKIGLNIALVSVVCSVSICKLTHITFSLPGL